MESGGGQIRDRGAHVMSNALLFMNADDTGPTTIEAKGTLPKKGLWDTAIEMEVVYTFKNPDWQLIWAQPGEKVPYFDRVKQKKLRIREGYGAVYHGEDGKCMHWGGDGGTWAERKVRNWRPPANFTDVYESPGHMEDWFKGIRTGEKTIMNIAAGAGVANLTVLGNLAFQLGRPLTWDQAKQEVVGDEQARRMMGRPQRHPYHL